MEWKQIDESKPERDVMVLCAGANGGYFVGYWRRDDVFYAPNYRGVFRTAVAWTEFDSYEEKDEK